MVMKINLKEESFSSLNGLPKHLDFKRYAKLLTGQKEILAVFKKKANTAQRKIGSKKQESKLAIDLYIKSLIESHSGKNPGLREAINGMGDSERFSLSVLTSQMLRIAASESNAEINKYHRIFELMLVDEFLEAIGEAVIGNHAKHAEINKDNPKEYIVPAAYSLLGDYKSGSLHIMDRLIAAEFYAQTINPDTVIPEYSKPFLAELLNMRIGEKIIQAIQNKSVAGLETKAANALFGISVMMNSTWVIALACNLIPGLYERHFESLPTIGDLVDDIKQTTTKINLGFASFAMSAVAESCHAIGYASNLHGVKGKTDIVGIYNTTSIVGDALAAMNAALDETTSTFLPQFRDHLEIVASGFLGVMQDAEKRYPTLANGAHAALNGLYSRIRGIVEKATDLNSVVKIIGIIDVHDGMYAEVKELLARHDEIRKDLSAQMSLVANDLQTGNGGTEKAIEKMKSLTEKMESSDKEYTALFNAVFCSIDQLVTESDAEIATNIEAMLTKDAEPDQEPVPDSLSEIERHMDEMTAENESLKKELSSATNRLETMEKALVGRDAAGLYLAEDKKAAIEQALTGKGLTPEQALLVVSAMRDNVLILPTAFESAYASEDFSQCGRLLSLLLTLTGDYLTAIQNGTPDTEARKHFSLNEYAANESETTMSAAALRKQRTYTVDGEDYCFEQHLRIGVAQDTRKTIRVYFRVINGRMVIAYCGPHKPLLG